MNPNTFSVQTYLALVKQMHIASSTSFDAETFKQVDSLLQQFSKTHQAWSVTVQVLTLPGLSEQVGTLTNNNHFRSTSMRQAF